VQDSVEWWQDPGEEALCLPVAVKAGYRMVWTLKRYVQGVDRLESGGEVGEGSLQRLLRNVGWLLASSSFFLAIYWLC
jgi:hypothetical protein